MGERGRRRGRREVNDDVGGEGARCEIVVSK